MIPANKCAHKQLAHTISIELDNSGNAPTGTLALSDIHCVDCGTKFFINMKKQITMTGSGNGIKLPITHQAINEQGISVTTTTKPPSFS